MEVCQKRFLDKLGYKTTTVLQHLVNNFIGFYKIEADKWGFSIEMEMNPTVENLKLKAAHLQQVMNLSKKRLAVTTSTFYDVSTKD